MQTASWGEAVCEKEDLSADQGEYGNTKRKQSKDNGWNCQSKNVQTVE
jgi:hypothetical protein